MLRDTSGEELAVLSTSNDRKEVETAHRILYIPADIMAVIVEDTKVEVVEEITTPGVVKDEIMKVTPSDCLIPRVFLPRRKTEIPEV